MEGRYKMQNDRILQEKIEKLEQGLLYAKNIASDILSNNCNIGYARQEVAKILYTR